MSKTAYKDLVDLIDSRIASSKTDMVGEIIAVSEDNKTATVSIPGTTNTYEFFNKSNEVLEEKDSVVISTKGGDLMNGFIANRFGESSWLIAGKQTEIEDGSVDEDKIADDTINSGHIKDGAIIGEKIADFTVDNAKIGFAAIDTANIRDATITTAKIQDAAITNAKIGNAEIDNAKIAIAAIDTANIKNAAITNACIATEAVGTSQIADGSITDAKIVSVTADKLTAGTIDAGTIDVVNLKAASITVGKINGVQIADGAIGIAQLDALVNDKITTAQATADGKNTTYYGTEKPTGGTYIKGDTWFDSNDGYKIYTYDGTDFVAMPLGAGAIDNSAITATKLADGSVTGVKMVEGAVTAREILTGAVTANALAANSVTANAIEAKSVNASHIETSTITADKLLLGDSTSYSTIDMLLYVPDDWTDWTNIVVPGITQDANKFIKTAQTTDTDLLFSLPYSSSILSTTATDNEFGFSFTLSNDSGTNKTVLLSAYFFDFTKKFLSKTTIETFSSLSTETSKKIEAIKTFLPVLDAKYFCFGISIADGFSCGIKSIQIRKTAGSTFISNGAITTDKIVANAITGAKIAAQTVTANNIVANTITSNEIATGAITAGEIAANAITASKIKAGEITTSHVNSAFGQSLDLSSNTTITITAAQIQLAGAVTFTNLSTAGQTTINGANVTTSNLVFSGGIKGSQFGISTGFSIGTTGTTTIPGSAPIRFGTNSSMIYSSGSGFYVCPIGEDLYLSPTSGNYSRIGNLYATTQPYNVPMTANTGSTEKINKIVFKPGSGTSDQFLQIELASSVNGGSTKGITAWNSDMRYKKNISDATENALKEIQKIQIRQYNWLDNGAFEPFGIVAQEAEKISERFVLKVPSEGVDWYQLKPHEFIPLLTKGIQELSSQLTQAQNEITILKAKTDAYDSVIHEMRLEIEKLKNGMVA